MKAKTKRRIHSTTKRILKTSRKKIAKTGRKRVVLQNKIKRLSNKRVLKKRHSRRLLRSAYVLIATVGTGSLAFAIATTRPTVNIHVQPQQTVKTTLIDATGADQVGIASWYAFGLPAPDDPTCASTTFPRGTYLQVTNRRNGKSVVCLVDDYGPASWTGRQIDLSRGAFRQIEDLGAGTAPVEIKVLPSPPTSFNISLPKTLSQLFIGYQMCQRQYGEHFCEQNRQRTN